MSLKHNGALRLLAMCALAIFSLTAGVQAQPTDRGRGDRDGPGYRMGPGMMDRGHFGRMCSPRSAGLAEWRLESTGTEGQAD